jgi:hypothetical protein
VARFKHGYSVLRSFGLPHDDWLTACLHAYASFLFFVVNEFQISDDDHVLEEINGRRIKSARDGLE